MTETRTPKQIAADKIDKRMRKIEADLFIFGTNNRDPKITQASDIVFSLRSRVRAHMHPRDREEAGQ